MKVLVVDDVYDIRSTLIEVVKSFGEDVEVVEAANGLDARQKVLNNGPFDIIITDNNMPEMSGVEFLRWLRLQPAHREVKMIIMSGWRTAEIDSLLSDFCGIDFFKKPYDPDQLRKYFN